MSTTLEWPEIALRLGLTIVAGALLGINRTERGVAAGLRTVILVSLAAAVSMIQANLLLGTAGKPSDSFVSLDVMRLPLGILTGTGFIGGGAILRQGDTVLGVTTAATLWLGTVLGLCFGGGQHVLGVATLGLGGVTLRGVKRLELGLRQDRHGTLTLAVGPGGPTDEEIAAGLKGAGTPSPRGTWPTRSRERGRGAGSVAAWCGEGCPAR